jgi:four helix bundle protein
MRPAKVNSGFDNETMNRRGAMDFEDWEKSPPLALRKDPLWRMTAYRLALFAGERGWEDIALLERSPSVRLVADQLYRALGSVGANIAEGYNRSSGRDRVRHYEYALGSTRESIHWYLMSRPILGDQVTAQRTAILELLRRHLLVAIPAERHRSVVRTER